MHDFARREHHRERRHSVDWRPGVSSIGEGGKDEVRWLRVIAMWKNVNKFKSDSVEIRLLFPYVTSCLLTFFENTWRLSTSACVPLIPVEIKVNLEMSEGSLSPIIGKSNCIIHGANWDTAENKGGGVKTKPGQQHAWYWPRQTRIKDPYLYD